MSSSPRSFAEYKIQSRRDERARLAESGDRLARLVLESFASDTCFRTREFGTTPGRSRGASRSPHLTPAWENRRAAPPVEQHLADLAERCSAIVKQWAATSERHALAVGELESKLSHWNDVAAGLQRDATGRFQDLERVIGHEWASLRRLHEEPVRQLRDQAESLTEICVSTAGSTQTGIERAEARLALLEKDLHRRMDDLSRDVHAVLDELRQQNGTTVRSPSSSWALEEVTRLHHEIRDVAGAGKNPPTALALLAAPSPTQSAGDVRRGQSTGPSDAADDSQLPAEPETSGRFERKWFAAVAALALVIAIGGGFSLLFYNRARLAAEQAAAAQQRAEVIGHAANDRIDAAQRDAADANRDRARRRVTRANHRRRSGRT